MNTVFAIAGVVIKELYRRKDFYVLFVLSALITIGAGSINFFKDLICLKMSRKYITHKMTIT